MDEVKKYWRDRLLQLLGWGTAAVAALAAWSIDKTEAFELGPLASQSCDYGNGIRAVALLLFSVGFGVGWYRSIAWIYRVHLSHDTDATVIPQRATKAYAALITTTLIVIALLMSLG